MWKNHSSSPYNTKTDGAAISAMDMSSDGKFVVTAVESTTTLKLWEEGSKKWEKDDFTLSLKDAAINSEGTHLAVAAYFDLLFFSSSSNEEVWSDNPWADSGDSDEFTTVAISDNHQYIAAGTFGGNVWVYDTSSSDPIWYHSGG